MVVSTFKYSCSNPPLASHFPPDRAHGVNTSPLGPHCLPLPHLVTALQPHKPPHSLGYSRCLPPPPPIQALPFSTVLCTQQANRHLQAPSMAPRHWLPAELSQREAPAGQSAEGGRVQVEIMGFSPCYRGWFPPYYSPAKWSLLQPLPRAGPAWCPVLVP